MKKIIYLLIPLVILISACNSTPNKIEADQENIPTEKFIYNSENKIEFVFIGQQRGGISLYRGLCTNKKIYTGSTCTRPTQNKYNGKKGYLTNKEAGAEVILENGEILYYYNAKFTNKNGLIHISNFTGKYDPIGKEEFIVTGTSYLCREPESSCYGTDILNQDDYRQNKGKKGYFDAREVINFDNSNLYPITLENGQRFYYITRKEKVIDGSRGILSLSIHQENIKKNTKKKEINRQRELQRLKIEANEEVEFIKDFNNLKKHKEFTSNTCDKINKEKGSFYLEKSNFETKEEYVIRRKSAFNKKYEDFTSPIFFIDLPPANTDYDLKNNEWNLKIIKKSFHYTYGKIEQNNDHLFVIDGSNEESWYNGKSIFGIQKEVFKKEGTKCLINSKSISKNLIKFKTPLAIAKKMVEPEQRVYFKIIPTKAEYSGDDFYELELKTNDPTIELPYDLYIKWALLEVDIIGIIYHDKGKPIKGFKF